MLAFKFPDPYAGPLKPGATPFPFPNQLEESFQYAPVFDDSDDEYATSLALPEKLRSFQYAPVFDSDDEYAASLALPAQLESFQHAPVFNDNDSDDECAASLPFPDQAEGIKYAPVFDESDDECAAPLPSPAQLKSLQYTSVFDSDDDCAAPLSLPDRVESMKYAPAFDSDDEYVTDDGALSICSSLASEFSFRRRPVPVATKNPVSLIALELDAIRKDNIGFEDGEWEDSDWDNHSDGDYAPLKEANLAAGIVFDEELAQAVGRPPNASKPIENQAPDGHQATEVAHDDISTCAQPTHKTGLVVFANKAITNLKWCGGNITRLCTKTKCKQHTTPAAAARNQEAQAEESNEEEVNPYDMFFGSGQHQSMRV
jgi:hypothetical protein